MLITLEGPDASGKTSQVKYIKKYFDENNIDYIVTREPGGTKLSEEIRKLIMDNEITSDVDCLLFAAARIDHLENVIKPALKEGKIVLIDRYIDSSLVYQGLVKDKELDEILNINRYMKKYMPNLTIYIDIPVDETLKRVENENKETNKFDIKGKEYHTKVRNSYLKLLDIYKERMIKVNGMQSEEDLSIDIINIIKKHV